MGGFLCITFKTKLPNSGFHSLFHHPNTAHNTIVVSSFFSIILAYSPKIASQLQDVRPRQDFRISSFRFPTAPFDFRGLANSLYGRHKEFCIE